ncbi:hypothetical protein PUR61_44550 [Streptomyces sp. BE20]|uniref:hypothetical protein n=1 Tax=unclassified Streptomyces TaxID=2593676 RepID=UPI002E76B43F|nr:MULTISPECIES: hypothetical protein [unclassified Streptomyces]MED7954557.1 hypothetical protein [Streptomyces sp. BE303]MEE1829189.1 hypothetical protein [Streptomyces sp. BE20]
MPTNEPADRPGDQPDQQPAGRPAPPPGDRQPDAPPPGDRQPDDRPRGDPSPGVRPPGDRPPGDRHSDELAELRARLSAVEDHDARLTARLKAQATQRHHRVRSSFAVLLVLLACVLTPLSVAAAWTKSQITDTDRYVATMAPLARDPAIQAAVTDRVTTEIMKHIPVESLLESVAPDDRPRLSALLGPVSQALTSGLTGFVHDRVEQLVGSDAFATVWTEINRNAHAAVEKMLTGHGGGAVAIKDDTVVLDLAPLIDRAKTRLIDSGLSVASKIPEVHTEYTLVQSDAIPKVRTAFRLLDLAGFWLPVLTVACAVAGVLLAVRRRRAAVTVALGIAGGALVLGIGLSVFRAVYLDKLPAGVDQAAASAVYDALVRYLRSAVRVVIALGLLVALGAWLSGPGRWARTVRGMWASGLAAVRHSAERAGLRFGPVGRFVHRWKTWLGWVAVAGAALAFLFWSYPTALVTLCLALALLAVLAVLEFLDEPGGGAGHPA